MADAEYCDLGLVLFEQYGRNFDLFNVGHFSEVVHVVVGACLVQTAHQLKAHWVVVVAVDRKNRQPDAQRRVQEVCIFEVFEFKFVFFGLGLDFLGFAVLHRAVFVLGEEHISVEDVRGCEVCFLAGSLVMKQISS